MDRYKEEVKHECRRNGVKEPEKDGTWVHPNDEDCSFCEEKAVLVIQGPGNCYYCGHQINFCEKHTHDLIWDVNYFKSENL